MILQNIGAIENCFPTAGPFLLKEALNFYRVDSSGIGKQNCWKISGIKTLVVAATAGNIDWTTAPLLRRLYAEARQGVVEIEGKAWIVEESLIGGKGNTVENDVVAVLVLSTAENAKGLEERVDLTFEVEKANSDRFGVLKV